MSASSLAKLQYTSRGVSVQLIERCTNLVIMEISLQRVSHTLVIVLTEIALVFLTNLRLKGQVTNLQLKRRECIRCVFSLIFPKFADPTTFQPIEH